MSQWIAKELGPDMPLHFSAFHPDHKMPDVPATPLATLVRARALALNQGLQFVYTGNVRNRAGDTTVCPNCGVDLIERDWYAMRQYRLTPQGRCPDCGSAVAGRYAARAGNFGRKRVPIAIGA
jgi:pyruvate formate lyase activating enzyme